MEISLIAVDKIIVAEKRQRTKMNDKKLIELRASIIQRGLLHPIVLTDDNNLVVGARRLTALKQILEEDHQFFCNEHLVPKGMIPYLRHNSDAVGLREAELEENILREELSWQDRCVAVEELHSLRLAQNPKQSVTDTAKELDAVAEDAPTRKTREEIARSIIVKEFLDDPEVAQARTLPKAFNIVSRKLEAEFMAGKKFKSPHKLIVGDFRERDLPAEFFDCSITDPPYGMGADEFGDAAHMQHSYKDDLDYAYNVSLAVIENAYRITKPQSHLFLFCDIDLFLKLRDYARDFGWTPWRTPIIWDKHHGHIPGLNWFRRTYECILFAHKGGKPLAFNEGDILRVTPDKDRVVAAQKPALLYSKLIKLSCTPGDNVIDLCCGSGTIFRAAAQTGVIATGIERDPETAKLTEIARLGEDLENAE